MHLTEKANTLQVSLPSPICIFFSQASSMTRNRNHNSIYGRHSVKGYVSKYGRLFEYILLNIILYLAKHAEAFRSKTLVMIPL